MIRIKRIYEPAAEDDGVRILVDRLWPRGMSRQRAAIDDWLPDAGPSTGLRRWFGHDPDRWSEFRQRYRAELDDNPRVGELIEIARGQDVTLVYSARDTEHNQAAVLAELVSEHLAE